MPTVTVTSNKYQQFTFAGVRPISIGAAIAISEEEADKIKAQYAEFSPNIKSVLQVQILGDEPVLAATVAIAPAPVTPAPDEDEEPEEVPDITELSDDDLDLIQIEINKLLGKTIAEAEPQLLNTALNNQLPLTLRKMYLEEVGKHPDLQKGLKDIAAKALEQL